MDTTYTLLKFVHVAAAVVWVGGVAMLAVVNARLTRERDDRVLAALGAANAFYGRAVLAPAAAVTLLAGIATAGRVGYSLGSLWIAWGFAAIAAFLLLGAWPIRQATQRLAAGDGDATALRRRLAALGVVNVLLLLSAVWAMVAKPTI